MKLKVKVWMGVFLLSVGFCFVDLNAQEKSVVEDTLTWRDITRCTSYGIGSANLYDTYLSPQDYTGTEYSLQRENQHPTRFLSTWKLTQQTLFQGHFSYADNRSEKNTDWAFHAQWEYILYRTLLSTHFRNGNTLTLQAGPGLQGQGGMIYNLANGNNPVAVKVGGDLVASLQLGYRFSLWKRSFLLRYQATAPFIGVHFAPHYGASYYEMFSLGNDEDITSITYPGNQPSIYQHFSLDVPVWRGNMLRASYIWDVKQTDLNELRYHSWSHRFMIGFVHQFYRKPNR